MRFDDGEIWERLGFSDGLDIQQKLDILRVAQGRVTREKGKDQGRQRSGLFYARTGIASFYYRGSFQRLLSEVFFTVDH